MQPLPGQIVPPGVHGLGGQRAQASGGPARPGFRGRAPHAAPSLPGRRLPGRRPARSLYVVTRVAYINAAEVHGQ
ncbi:hypothetical protein GCM10010306_081680 [Streptomyces umbrinus]|nr:hypothetical protein GCM10010306_081680 [Streptomyces umbrinus]